jgi:hypothetical protein
LKKVRGKGAVEILSYGRNSSFATTTSTSTTSITPVTNATANTTTLGNNVEIDSGQLLIIMYNN